MITIEASKSCRANTEKMQKIYLAIYQANLGKSFEDFITRRFPWLIKSDKKVTTKKIIEKQQRKPGPRATAPYRQLDYSDLNKHKVFKSYKPNLLTFPQKLIMAGNPTDLFDRVQHFCRDKLAIDYIIIEDRAYVEYFLPKYSVVVDRYPRDRREIFQYRMRQQNA